MENLYKLVLIEVAALIDARPGRGTRGAVLPPYPVECLGAFLKNYGNFQVDVLQIFDLTDDQVLEKIRKLNPDAVGLTVFTHTAKRAINLTELIKSAMPQTKVIWGGYEPSLVPRKVAGSGADFFVIGEGEDTALELFNRLAERTGQSFGEIRGLSFVRGGKPIVTKPRPRIRDLDRLPWADRVSEYMERSRIYGLFYPEPERQRRTSEIYYSRGCPHNCNFCVSAVQYGVRHGDCPARVAYRSAENVVEELKHLQGLGVNALYWTDLNGNTPHGLSVFEAMAKEGIHDPTKEGDSDHARNSIHSYALCRVPLTEADAQAMAEAGFTRIGLGIESFSSQAQEWYGKPHTGLEISMKSLQAADKYGIANRCLLVIGHPHDTVEAIEGLADYLHEIEAPIDEMRVACMTPYEGTPLYDEVKDLIVTDNQDLLDTDHFVTRTETAMPEDLEKARRSFLRRYYSDPRYLSRRVMGRLERWPHLRPTYNYFLEFLHQQGLAEHKI